MFMRLWYDFYLVYKNMKKSKIAWESVRAAAAAVHPLHEVKKEWCQRAVGQPHLHTCTTIGSLNSICPEKFSHPPHAVNIRPKEVFSESKFKRGVKRRKKENSSKHQMISKICSKGRLKSPK